MPTPLSLTLEDQALTGEHRLVAAFLTRVLADATSQAAADAAVIWHRAQAQAWLQHPDAVWLEVLELAFEAWNVVHAGLLEVAGLEERHGA